MQRPRVDPETALAIHRLLQQCAVQGRDAVRALDERGHLTFPALERWQAQGTLDAIAAVLELSSLDAIMRALPELDRPMTPFDTKRVIVAWLRLLAQQQVQLQPTPPEEKQQ